MDSAIICLENTHRHLGLGAEPEEAAFLGASEVAMPELAASLGHVREAQDKLRESTSVLAEVSRRAGMADVALRACARACSCPHHWLP